MKKAIGIQLEDKMNVMGTIDLKIQVIRDVDNKIISGLTVGHTLHQNKAIILTAQPGEIKTRPDLGVGIIDFLEDNDYQKYKTIIPDHFLKDGLKVRAVTFSEKLPLEIDCSYE